MVYGRVLIFISFFWLVSEIILARMRRAKPTAVKFESASLRLLWITIMVSVGAGVSVGMHSPGRIDFHPLLFTICIPILIVMGLVLRWVAILSLGRHFTVNVAVIQNHRLVNTGIYRYIRHTAEAFYPFGVWDYRFPTFSVF